RAGESVDSLGLTGREVIDIKGLSQGIAEGFRNKRSVTVSARREDGSTIEFEADVRIDTPQEILYYVNGGILQYVLRQLLNGKTHAVSGTMADTPQPEHDTKLKDGDIDEGSIESFPASDPPAY